MNRRLIGIDMGGTKLEAAIVDVGEGFRFVSRRRVSTEQEGGYDHILSRVAALIDECVHEEPRVAAVGVGMPGSVTVTGAVKNANTVCLNGRSFRADLQQRVNVPLVFANDANCFALAEARFGAGRGCPVVFGVIMGTGVGGGLVIDGQVREGLQSICGEWGHTILWPDDRFLCYCGKSGCTELFLSGPGIATRYAQRKGERLALPDILLREQAGDAAAVACVDEWMDNFGRALSNVINIVDPDVVVLGGGVSNALCLYDRGVEKVARYLFSDQLRTPIRQHRIGDSAGVLGAALLTWPAGED